MLSTPTYIISYFLNWPQMGSGFLLPAHREGGARASIEFVIAKNPVRPSKGMAEGGCGGNSAAPERSAGAKRRRSVSFKVGSSKVQNIPPLRHALAWLRGARTEFFLRSGGPRVALCVVGYNFKYVLRLYT